MRTFALSLVALITLFASTLAPAQTTPRTYPWPTYSVLPILFVPKDWDINSQLVQEDASALRTALPEIRNFYARALGGNTFHLNELVVLQGDGAKEAYGIHWTGGNIYADGITLDPSFQGAIMQELYDRGYPTPPAQNEGGYSVLVFVKGAGGYAGSNRLQYADGGFGMLGDWAIDSIAGRLQDWEYSWGSGRNPQIGASAHELGHTFGLVHVDVYNGDVYETVMGAWNMFPNIGLSDYDNNILNTTKLKFFNECLPPNPVAAPPATKPYTLTMLPTLGGDTYPSYINQNGTIVGTSNDGRALAHLAVFSADGSAIFDLGSSGGSEGSATSINAAGVVSGYWGASPTQRHATRSHLDSASQQWMTEELPAVSQNDSAVACSINDNGTIVGGSREFNGQAAIWSGSGATAVTIGTSSLAQSINNRGQVAGRMLTDHGQRAFLWNDNGNNAVDAGELQDLGVASTLPTAYSEAYFVNDLGQVAGSAFDGGMGRRFAFTLTPQDGQYFVPAKDGTNSLMKVLPRLGEGIDYALSINKQGVAVGRSGTCEGWFEFHATLWQNDTVADLNQWADVPAGTTLRSAESINDSGVIVGWASTPQGVRGFILRPVAPVAPQTVGTPTASATGVMLAWQSANQHTYGFEIQRREITAANAGNDLGWGALITVPPSTVNYTDATVHPNATYQYRIRAFDATASSPYVAWAPVDTVRTDPPIAAADSYTLSEDGTLKVTAMKGMLANDRGVQLQVVSIATAPLHGTVEFSSDGAFRFKPNHNYFGGDRFTYVIRDANGVEAQAIVTLKVKGEPDRPNARDDRYTTKENKKLCVDAPGLLRNDKDADHDMLKVELKEGPKHGKVDLNKNGSFCYKPKEDFHGDDRFEYTVKDPTGRKDHGTVKIEVEKTKH